jgi:malonate-semialdehyde dehydrogenase (acetylating)/methylmalonate-semialdehyde dehydrogenase
MTNTTVPHWIDGKRDLGTTDRTAPVYDPALGKETKLSLIHI